MTFRDDHDAALARADALEQQLERARDEATDTRAALAKSEAERRRLAREVAELRPYAPKPVDADRPRPIDAGRPPSPRRSSNAAAVLVAGVLVAILVIGLAAIARSRESSAPPNPLCTIQTNPAGAEIYIIRTSSDPFDPAKRIEYETRLGRSPLTQTREEWIMQGVIGDPVRMEARLAGQTLVVRTPLDGMGCASAIYSFAR